MILSSVFIRFYKSFNYDYVRKHNASSRHTWEFINNNFYPFVEVPIDPSITAIVGANESGKSHLLSAIAKGLNLNVPNNEIAQHERESVAIERQDFCRYSSFFASTQESQTYPDFGFKWINLTPKDLERLRKIVPSTSINSDTPIFYFRFDKKRHEIYIGGDSSPISIEDAELPGLYEFLPRVFRIESAIALPDSVSILQLLEGRMGPEDKWKDSGRRQAFKLLEEYEDLDAILSQLESIPQAVGSATISIQSTLQAQIKKKRADLKVPLEVYRERERRAKISEFNLAYDLLFDIASIKREDIELLHTALKDGRTGVVRSIVDKINQAIGQKLNFARVWAQDRDFTLQIEATDHELNFLISDRTGCHYSFDERSSGLKHFLSYYIQYLRYQPKSENEILMMDEPDAFLSGEAQGDLLKVFDMFVDAQNPKRKGMQPLQVVYVTHSPFLIDKNHSERVQALEKGEGWRGTRVVKSAGQNHYEPLRSAFGPFVGETTFISGCNLITEGQGDQILLAGVSSFLRKRSDIPENETLDLNRLTIVPSAGASTVPYFVYLARGRGGDKPALIVLVDSDSAGNDAKKKVVTKAGEHLAKKALLPESLVVQIGDIPKTGEHQHTLLELEDLVPLPIAFRAAQHFLANVFAWDSTGTERLKLEDVQQEMDRNKECAFFSINRILAPLFGVDPHNDKELVFGKVAFARTVVDLLPTLHEEEIQKKAGATKVDSKWQTFESTMRALFALLRERQLQAEHGRGAKLMRERVEEIVKTFVADHGDKPVIAKHVGQQLTQAIEEELRNGDEEEMSYMRQVLVLLRERFQLRVTPIESIRDLSYFMSGVESLRLARENVAAQIPPNQFLSGMATPEPLIRAVAVEPLIAPPMVTAGVNA